MCGIGTPDWYTCLFTVVWEDRCKTFSASIRKGWGEKKVCLLIVSGRVPSLGMCAARSLQCLSTIVLSTRLVQRSQQELDMCSCVLCWNSCYRVKRARILGQRDLASLYASFLIMDWFCKLPESHLSSSLTWVGSYLHHHIAMRNQWECTLRRMPGTLPGKLNRQ